MRRSFCILTIVFACATFLLGTIAWAEEKPSIIASGNCGNQVTWMLNSEGSLIVSGEGKMKDYFSNVPAPWDDYRSEIKNVVIEKGVTVIGTCAFSKCSSLVEVSLPDGLTTIKELAFQSCSSLPAITFPASVTHIGDAAFESCSSLININFPDNLTSIEYAAFRGCSSLVSVSIPSSVTFIDYYAFSHPTSMVATVEKGSYAYRWCIINNVQFSVDVPIISFGTCGIDAVWDLDAKGTLTISGKGEMRNYPYGNRPPWYSYYSSIDNLVIEEGVTSIGGRAFEGGSSLVSVSLPNSLTSIREYAFHTCNSLASINLPDSLTTIGPGAFFCCSSLASINIPDSDISIGGDAFAGCRNLKHVLIPSEARPTFTLYGAPLELTVFCYESSEVDSWATENGYKVAYLESSTPTPTRVPGDVNEDGKINSRDALAIVRYAVGQDVSINTANADVNADGKINSRDALAIIRYAVGQDVTLK